MEALVAHGADLHARNEKEGAPLHFAAVWRTGAVEALIERGADINARSHDGITPLLVADPEVEKMMLAREAELEERDE